MATFVLVHGGWTGAHGWRAVRRLLAGAGHEVFTPSLTGIGERVHLVSPQVDLTTHIQDVVNQVLYEDLEDIVLVGHSYGGFVATGAVRHVHERIRELVFLDAFVPADGDTVLGLAGNTGPSVLRLGADWLVPPLPREFDDPVEGAWQNARRVPHPTACFSEPVRLYKPLEEYDFGLTYIKATLEPREAPGGQVFWAHADHARESGHWGYYEVATNHMVANNKPQELAGLLTEIAGNEAR
jgi:pimeloyl-ACP methyl ester carboxylesterase